ncbi:MAG: SMP-30/gluconolactonase/LRE family protein [Chitinispirillaceae bacterium]|jgi:sugar lactone lactonase YvrE
MLITILKTAGRFCLPGVFVFGSASCAFGQSFGTVTLPSWLADSGIPVQRAATSTPTLNQWAEGPVMARNGTAFFSEQNAGNIWKVSAAGVMTKLVTVTSGTTNYVNGLDFNPIDGNLVVCEQARITERDTTDGHVIKVITSGTTWGQGANDLTFASNGDLFFTCFNQHIFFHSKDSSVNEDWNYAVPANCEWNGIEYIEEKGIIYLCQYGQNKVLTFKVSPATHLIDTSTQKTFAAVTSPDGITVDSLYNVYIASNTTGGAYPESIVAYDSTGKVLGSIHMIQKLPSTSLNTTNCVFGNFPFGGGTDPKALYITGDSGLFKVQLKVAGRVRPVATAVRRASGTFPYVNAAGPRTALRLFLGTNSPADAGLFAYDGIKNAVLFNLLGQRAGRHVPDKAPSAVYILQNKATR